MATSDHDSKQALIEEILPDISDSERARIKEILGPEFESWSSVKEGFINDWKSGRDKPVKVVASDKGSQETVGGYFTEERWIKGCTPKEMEQRLGFAAGKLKNGATIYELDEIPDKSQFKVRGYTHILPKEGSGSRAEFVQGSGINQFQLNESVSIPAKVIGKVGYEEPWKGPSREQNAVSAPLSTDSGNAPSSEAISRSVGQVAGSVAAGSAGGEAGKVIEAAADKAQQKVVGSIGPSTEDPAKAKENSSDEEQTYKYGHGY